MEKVRLNEILKDLSGLVGELAPDEKRQLSALNNWKDSRFTPFPVLVNMASLASLTEAKDDDILKEKDALENLLTRLWSQLSLISSITTDDVLGLSDVFRVASGDTALQTSRHMNTHTRYILMYLLQGMPEGILRVKVPGNA